jgi:hypothetical protein
LSLDLILLDVVVFFFPHSRSSLCSLTFTKLIFFYFSSLIISFLCFSLRVKLAQPEAGAVEVRARDVRALLWDQQKGNKPLES